MPRIADAVGRVLGGRYRLLAPIGSGASAAVYLAEDVKLDRRVAVKLLHGALAEDEGFLRRFRAEAKAAAALSHPNVMRVYDWGEDDDGPYLVLELFDGGSLRDLLDGGHRLSLSQALVVGIDVARGLDYAHRRGLVHRDIKPANLLFDEEGRVCVADFGLARALAEAAVTEPSGAVLGTARYAAPEQARGATLDGRADVYALALVLVEAVTGDVPFLSDTTLGTLMARVDRDLPVPEAMGPLASALTLAGRGDPAERTDAAGLARALDAAAPQLPAPAALPLAAGANGAPGASGPLPILSRAHPTEGAARTDLTEHGAPTKAGAVGRRRRWPRRAAAAVLAALVLTGAGVALAQALVPAHPVPELVERTLADAQRRARAAGLKVAVERRAYDEKAPAGVVVAQRPAPGKQRKANRPIELTVSRGPPPVAVPDLAGQTQDAARDELARIGLVLGVVTPQFDNAVPAGQVMTWSGRDGSLPKGSEVAVTVSAGPKPIPVPEVGGSTYDEAAAELSEAGFAPVREDVFSDEVPVGKVVGTRPTAGSEAQPRSKVTIRVSKGPEMVAVPDVIGMELDAARLAIGRAGLQAGSVYGPNRRDRVRDTDPQPGVKVRRGTVVTFYV